MVGKRKRFILVSVLTAAIFLWGCTSQGSNFSEENSSPDQEEVFTIGISQLVEHPALDSAREGFIDGLASLDFIDGENISIKFENAQGDIPTSQVIAQNFVDQKVDMIFAIATPAAQSAFNVTKEIPIVITAVTDPVEAGLAESWSASNTNVTGTSDMAPIKEQFALLKELVPDASTVGILYNTSEPNSEIQVEHAKEEARSIGIDIQVSGVTSTNEISPALDTLLERVDVLYIPTDNLMASSMPLIINETHQRNIPVIGSESAHVEAGALVTEGLDYYELGFQTGLMAVDVIGGKAPQELPISTLDNTKLIINEDSAERLNITIPDSLLERGEIIQGGAAS